MPTPMNGFIRTLSRRADRQSISALATAPGKKATQSLFSFRHAASDAILQKGLEQTSSRSMKRGVLQSIFAFQDTHAPDNQEESTIKEICSLFEDFCREVKTLVVRHARLCASVSYTQRCCRGHHLERRRPRRMPLISAATGSLRVIHSFMCTVVSPVGILGTLPSCSKLQRPVGLE